MQTNKIQIFVDDILQQKNLLEHLNVPYKLKISGSSKKLYCKHDGVEHIYKDTVTEYSMKELIFIKKVRNEIISNCKAWEKKNKRKIEKHISYYIDYSKNMPYSVSNCIEIDLNSAYWYLAHDMGYISNETFQMGLDIDREGNLIYRKKVRLAALGSIARLDRFITWDGLGTQHENYELWTERNEYAKAFFNISRYIYDIMNCCASVLGKDFLFFWVDAIFFINRPENISNVVDVIEQAGLKYKQYYISKFEFVKKDSKITVTSPDHKELNRTFNLKKV